MTGCHLRVGSSGMVPLLLELLLFIKHVLLSGHLLLHERLGVLIIVVIALIDLRLTVAPIDKYRHGVQPLALVRIYASLEPERIPVRYVLSGSVRPHHLGDLF